MNREESIATEMENYRGAVDDHLGTGHILEHFRFIKEFFRRENLAGYKWEDIQKLGEHLDAFTSHALARANALGRPNHPIEHYTMVFTYLGWGEDPLETRVEKFFDDPRYKIGFFGASAKSEIVGLLFPENYMIMNRRDFEALRLLRIDTGFSKGDTLAQRVKKFTDACRPIAADYERIIGRRTDLPLFLELDQFFSYLYSKPGGRESQNYWWLNASPKEWDIETMPVGAEVSYSLYNDEGNPRRVKKYFEQLRVGDILVGYKTSPTMAITTICKVTKELGGDSANPEFYFRIERQLEHPIPLNALKKHVRILQGSLFKLTGEQFKVIQGLMNEEVKSRYWVIAPDEGAILWEQWQKDGIAAIGWDETGDLRKYKGETGKIAAKIEKAYQHDTSGMVTARAMDAFANAMKAGDYIAAKKGRKSIIGIGVVTSDYIFDANRESFKHVRNVDWKWTGSLDYQHKLLPMKTLTDMTEDEFFVRCIEDTLKGIPPKPRGKTDKLGYSREDALRELFIVPERLDGIIAQLKRKKNLILQGPPGVGKTYVARRLAWLLTGDRQATSRVKLIQFHQSYSYEDFIQGIRPCPGVGFQLKNGIFFEFCRSAEADTDHPYVLIIDEINRGNLSKIFGEVMMLIESDKRGPEFALQLAYADSKEAPFFVPRNLHVIGTMNTADRSLAMVDYALRRRFAFVDLVPQFDSDKFQEELQTNGVSPEMIETIRGKMEDLNVEISKQKDLGSDFRIGHSFFCPAEKVEDEAAWYDCIIDTEIAPLLREYWYDNGDKADELERKLLLKPGDA